jgi:hypothetical protein
VPPLVAINDRDSYVKICPFPGIARDNLYAPVRGDSVRRREMIFVAEFQNFVDRISRDGGPEIDR